MTAFWIILSIVLYLIDLAFNVVLAVYIENKTTSLVTACGLIIFSIFFTIFMTVGMLAYAIAEKMFD